MPPLNPFAKSCVALAVGQLLTLPTAAHAATITVNVNGDNGFGCNLREAIVSANTSVNQNNGCAIGSDAGTDMITFANNIYGNTITLTQGELSIGAGKDIYIDAGDIPGGIIIDANFQSRLLNISDATVSINSITLTRGGTEGGEQSVNAIEVQYSSLALSNSTVTNNLDGYGSSMFDAASSNVSINSSSISNNSSNYRRIISISNATNLILDNTVIDSNRASNGVVSLGGETVVINNTMISNNTSYGSTVLIRGDTSDFIDSAIVNNVMREEALKLFADSTTMTNSTISGNSSSDQNGSPTAGVELVDNTLNLINSTIANNNTASNILITYIAQNSDPSVTLVNSIIANSVDGVDCATNSFASFSDISSDSNSIIEDGSCNTQARSVDPRLGPLAGNGGSTLTHSLLPGSPAINTGNNDTCAGTDQRGEERPLNASNPCDVGAFEFIQGLDGDDEQLFIVPLPNGKSVVFEL